VDQKRGDAGEQPEVKNRGRRISPFDELRAA
jgi:hypothetical protein